MYFCNACIERSKIEEEGGPTYLDFKREITVLLSSNKMMEDSGILEISKYEKKMGIMEDGRMVMVYKILEVIWWISMGYLIMIE